MKRVTMAAKVDEAACIGCGICRKVCPVCAIAVEGRKAKIDDAACRGCANCADRCPSYAITMIKREQPFEVGVDADAFDRAKIEALCGKAHMNPEQVLCYCVGTRAEEVAAALLSGAKTPEEISSMTGMRTGCTIECIQPMLRLIEAAGLELKPDPDSWRWYGTTVTAWTLSDDVKEKYNSRGFYFDEDKALLEEIIRAPGSRGRGGDRQ